MRKIVRSLCCLLAALLLVLSLLTEIRTNTLRDENRALLREKAELSEEIRILEVRLDGRLSLEELERLAAERLGMRRCLPVQRVVLPPAE